MEGNAFCANIGRSHIKVKTHYVILATIAIVLGLAFLRSCKFVHYYNILLYLLFDNIVEIHR